jgi:hypothetical protein
MAEPKMNPNSQEQMMLVQSFEQMANAVGAEIPVNLSSEIAAVKAGKRMSGELQRMLAEGSMSLMNQLNPEMMPETEMSYEFDGRMERMSPEIMDSLIRSGQVTPDEMSTYMVDGRKERMAPSQIGGVTPRPSQAEGAVSDAEMQMYKNNLSSNVMSMDDAIAAGLVTPTRPRMRPAAPMQSPRPQARPMR